MIIFGAVPGVLGLAMAALQMGAMRRDVHDLLARAAGWDKVKEDVQYMRGRFEEQDVTRLSPSKRRPRLVAAQN